jgi:hypothetical protein
MSVYYNKFALVSNDDVIRVEFRNSGAVEGVWEHSTGQGSEEHLLGFVKVAPNRSIGFWDYTTVSDVKIIKRAQPTPPEPPAGSVVLDGFGWAWQSNTSRFFHVVSDKEVPRQTWEELHSNYGPISTIHIPSPEEYK